MTGDQSALIGRIVWAEIADQNGIRKLRPAVVVGVTQVEDAEELLTVVAVSSRLPDHLPDDHIELPWHPQRHPRTGLNRRSAVVCSWSDEITASDIVDVGGFVPDRELINILAKTKAFDRD